MESFHYCILQPVRTVDEDIYSQPPGMLGTEANQVSNVHLENGSSYRKLCLWLFFCSQTLDKGRGKLSSAMKACNDILKDIFTKKHAVSIIGVIMIWFITTFISFLNKS